MKPDWKDAPEWAKYLSMDEDGEWYWFENKPAIFGDLWRTHHESDGKYCRSTDVSRVNWKESLEPRP